MSKARDIASAGTALTTVSATELGYVDGVTSAIQTQIDAKEPTLPSQTGNSGKYLTTNGSAKSWGTVSQYSLPSQTGNSGKFLTTNGTAESWGTVNASPTITALATDVSVGTGTSFTIGSLSTNYIEIHFKGLRAGADWPQFWLRINGLSTSIYDYNQMTIDTGTRPMPAWATFENGGTKFIASYTGNTMYSGETYNLGIMKIYSAQTSGFKPFTFKGYFQNGGYVVVEGLLRTTAAITSVVGLTSGGTATFNAGTYTVYGG
jgi:hypothetical protein